MGYTVNAACVPALVRDEAPAEHGQTAPLLRRLPAPDDRSCCEGDVVAGSGSAERRGWNR